MIELPAVYICFGMAKSGSTLAFQITREVARQVGHPPARDGEILDAQGRRTSFIARWEGLDLGAMIAVARSQQRMLVLKTHLRPPAGMAEAVAAGDAAVQAVCRDPRDIALSMTDMGRIGGDWGLVDGKPIKRPEEAQRRIATHVARFERWAAMPNALCLNYERVAFDIPGTVERIARQLQVDVSPLRVASRIDRGKTHLNKGIARRHRTEMTAQQSEAWEGRFAAFISNHCSDVPEGRLETPQPSGPGALWRRVLGR